MITGEMENWRSINRDMSSVYLYLKNENPYRTISMEPQNSSPLQWSNHKSCYPVEMYSRTKSYSNPETESGISVVLALMTFTVTMGASIISPALVNMQSFFGVEHVVIVLSVSLYVSAILLRLNGVLTHRPFTCNNRRCRVLEGHLDRYDILPLSGRIF